MSNPVILPLRFPIVVGSYPPSVIGIANTAIIVPTGADQATAALLTAYDCVIESCDGTTGVILTSATKNYRVKVTNYDSSNDLIIYPLLGSHFKGKANNEPVILGAGNVREFVCYQNGEIR